MAIRSSEGLGEQIRVSAPLFLGDDSTPKAAVCTGEHRADEMRLLSLLHAKNHISLICVILGGFQLGNGLARSLEDGLDSRLINGEVGALSLGVVGGGQCACQLGLDGLLLCCARVSAGRNHNDCKNGGQITELDAWHWQLRCGLNDE